jgi:hypothetical protein
MRHNAFWMAMSLLFLVLALFSLWIAWRCSEPSLNRVWAEFEHVQVYEDGSYSGQSRGGQLVTGCLPGGLCQD